MTTARKSKLELNPTLAGHVALKGFFKITGDWGLSNSQQQILLGGIPDPTFFKYKKEPMVKLSKDLLERISFVMGIRKALLILFPTKQQADAWIEKANRDFGDTSALDAMLGGSITDLYRVRRYLDAWRG
jgi:uncharacterized protein (DUF2384 family)